ncbi:MAG: 4-hydroxythreonine-4-phosphate dehydrogenase PdxA [Myxococcales bacterium]|nr:4-hydroxythreonine-4-phosphate dehydrogenase PdxA [Myxococcales bacterium]MCB9708407.1 4-hydroxythreonine-4-phosphate dehydrogenase PdxA [Myxococcales bacterium]
MSTSSLPLAISCGDPAGVGPDIALRAALALAADCSSILFGDAQQLNDLARIRGIGPLPIISKIGDTRMTSRGVSLADVCRVASSAIASHAPNEQSGRAQLEFLSSATSAVLDKRVRALVTAPMSKSAVSMTGHRFQGHTEFLANAAGVADDAVSMLFIGPRLKVGLVTTHLQLQTVSSALTPSRICRTILHTAEATARLTPIRSGSAASMVVCGLNPHAGENGLFGNEEQQVIVPGMREAEKHAVFRHGKLRLVGPLGAETAFRCAAEGIYSSVVAMYHDQATIASKLIDWTRAVNVTWGLPFVRTSVDHGVAYDAAKSNIADATAMESAMRIALDLTR